MRGRTRNVWGPIIGSLLIVLTLNTVGQATHSPADKAVAAGSKIESLAVNAEETLLTAHVKNSKPTDLILTVSMECSIITDVTTGPSTVAGDMDDATARGKVRGWVTVDDVIVPINSTSGQSQPPPGAGADADKVTFCNRVHTQEMEDGEDAQDGLDKLRTYIETKNANSFTWLRLNMGAGPHTIKVIGEFSTSGTGEFVADAFVGNRSLIAEPEKLANDIVI